MALMDRGGKCGKWSQPVSPRITKLWCHWHGYTCNLRIGRTIAKFVRSIGSWELKLQSAWLCAPIRSEIFLEVNTTITNN